MKAPKRVRETAIDAPLTHHFPTSAVPLLFGTGREFLARLGEEATRTVVEGVLLGENVKSRTEPLTRRRLVQVNGALLAMYASGARTEKAFMRNVLAYAERQLTTSPSSDKALRWPAQWVLGLTQKQIQNVLRGGHSKALAEYRALYEEALTDAAAKCHDLFGPLKLSLSQGREDPVIFDWPDVARVFAAIGASTLAIRGSEKSMYGKLFERLVLGSCLTILGFKLVRAGQAPHPGEFWLSDSTDEREVDATVLVKPGHVARFDLGFIGKGNPEIVRDKLSRYAREVERSGVKHASLTIVIVDHVPAAGDTLELASRSNAAIVQMSMSLWPRTLAKILNKGYHLNIPLAGADDAAVRKTITRQMPAVPVLQFVSEAAPAEEGDVEEDYP